MELFGFSFNRKKEEQAEKRQESFVPKVTDDGAVVVAATGAYGTFVDLDGTIRTEPELITKYRTMAEHPELDMAIDEIVNDSINTEEDDIVDIILDNVEGLSDRTKEVIEDEFKNVLRLLEFNHYAYEIYRRWYIDGRMYYHAIIDENSPGEGIKEMRYIDPRKIRKVKEVTKKRMKGQGYQGPDSGTVVKTVNEYYVYNDKGFGSNSRGAVAQPASSSAQGIKISKDSIVHTTSGLTDASGTLVLSYLPKAIKPLNELRTLEDAVVIYRLARAPERRVWYIDVGSLPKMKAEQYVRDIMTKHKNKLVYNAETGEIQDNRKFMTMLEDYWLPRQEGGRGTQVETLKGGENLGQMDDVLYFQKKLYNSLNVPVSRINSDDMFNIGRSSEISREEIKFGKFISRLRTRFAMLFTKTLERQLVLKGITTPEDWAEIAPLIKYQFAHDSEFEELKNLEIFNERMNAVDRAVMYAGKYISHEYIRKSLLQQTDEDMKEQDKLIKKEMNKPQYQDVVALQNDDSAIGSPPQMIPGPPETPFPGQFPKNPNPAPKALPAPK